MEYKYTQYKQIGKLRFRHIKLHFPSYNTSNDSVVKLTFVSKICTSISYTQLPHIFFICVYMNMIAHVWPICVYINSCVFREHIIIPSP